MKERRGPKNDLMKNTAPIFFAFIVTCGFFFCVYRLQSTEFPPSNKDQLNQLIGVLITIWTLQMQWFFGSSAANKAKDETISDIAKMPVAPIAPVAPVAPILPIAPVTPINIPNAQTVKVETKEGDINVTPETPKENV